MLNITFDLETLGNSHKAPIVQIAAVAFQESGEQVSSYCANVDLLSLQQYDFQIDYSTLSWWLKQEQKAIESVFLTEPRVSLKEALKNFNYWVNLNTASEPDVGFWSHATFDPPILSYAFRQAQVKSVIKYPQYRDIRTLMQLYTLVTGLKEVPVTRTGIPHNALDDCLYQAKYIAGALAAITST